jgi:amino acid permease
MRTREATTLHEVAQARRSVDHSRCNRIDAEPNSSGVRELRRDLCRRHVLAIVVGTIVGTGIYIRPASIAQLLGSPALIIGVWLVGGMLTLCGTLKDQVIRCLLTLSSINCRGGGQKPANSSHIQRR